MPLLQATVDQRRFGQRRVRPRLVGLREEGGLVVGVNNLQGDLVLESTAGIIEEPGLEE